jgi:diacylglycerol kinase family enzyme
MSTRALLLVNRNSRQGQERYQEVINCLNRLGLTIIAESTEDATQLGKFIRQYQEEIDLVIVGGGDGTLNAAIEAIIETQLPLGILPLDNGTNPVRPLTPSYRPTTPCAPANGKSLPIISA